MTIAKVYGLKENPFEPTGTAVGKYPFVPPANFHALERKIEEAGIERKLYTLLVNSPHGAGKSTTMEYLKTKAINGGYLSFRAPVVLTKLSDLNVRNFVLDVLQEASNYTKIDSFDRLKNENRGSVLRKVLVDALSSIAVKNKLMLWIVDEFDILADKPREEQTNFLQFLRQVIEDLAIRDVPIAFIMSHTKYSSREFETHLSQMHGPFKSRIVASISLAYSFEEVKKIVEARLQKARETPRSEGDIFPFTEESLRALYDMILSVRGTDSLDNFRIFERVCHFALIEGAKRNLPFIDVALMRELFKEYGLKELPAREGRRISIKTAQEIAAMKLKSIMEKNEAILQGILNGISKCKLLAEMTIKNTSTSYLGQIGDGNIGLSSLSFDILHHNKSISIFWILATSKTEIIQENDFNDILQVIMPLLKDYKKYFHITLFSYVSSIEPSKIQLDQFTRTIWFSSGFAEDLIGLSVGSEEDVNILIKSFEAEIAPLLSLLINRETRDITAPLSSPALEAIQTIFVISANGQSCSKVTVRQINKRLFMRGSMLQERYINEAIQAGFAIEEAGQIKPSIPKAHKFLLDILEKGPQEYRELCDKLGDSSEAIVNSALEFRLVYLEGNKIAKRRLTDYEIMVLPVIKTLEKVLEDDVVKQSEPGKWIERLLNAYEYYKKSGLTYHAHVVLSAIEKLGPRFQQEIEKITIRKPEWTPSIRTPQPIQPPTTEKKTVPVITQFPEIQKGTLEDAILQAIRNLGPLSINEIEQQMKSLGYEADIRSTVFRLILQGKLKVVSAE
ncbi:MAG: hypothetical protein QXF61_08145 [Nitrososphaeria archaeon]